MTRSISEEDVYKSNKDFIKHCAERFGLGMETDERERIAELGFLFAIRSYRKSASLFHPYAEGTMRLFIQQAKKHSNYIKRSESRLSLDQPAYGESNNETVGSAFFYHEENYLNSIVFRDFINMLNEDMRSIAVMYIDGYTKNEIMEIRGISKQELEELNRNIISRWENYNGALN